VKSGELAFHDWLRRHRATSPDLRIPLGDDAAVIRWSPRYDLVVTTDAVAQGSHFLGTDPPRLIGRKALAVSLSDIAAMGAEPRFAFVTATLPHGFPARLPREISRGMSALAARHGVVVAGGDTNAHRGGIVLSTTVIGRARPGRAISRSGAKAGDLIAVTGALGGSFSGGRHFTFMPRVAEGLSLVKLGPPSAMMDVSDGLMLDLSRLIAMSGVGARVFADSVPVHPDAGRGRKARDRALSEGEDFELLFTMPEARLRKVLRAWKLRTPITVVGQIVGRGFTIVRDGIESRAQPRGFQHH
jgi:thiamine-monophosphate kinase